MSEELRTERYDKICHRLIAGDTIIGLIEQHSDNTWSVVDPIGRRLVPGRHASVSKALAAAKAFGLVVED